MNTVTSFLPSLTLNDFSKCMKNFEPFEKCPKIAVAVSGGPDSLCLTLLLHEWVKNYEGQIIALTVDHQLRPESSQEARQVHKWLSSQGIEHHTLVWQGLKPTTAIQNTARQVRYHLLEQWCQKHNIRHLATAHHADDQIETIFQRLAKGSGLTGLCGILPITQHHFIRVIRPFLTFSKNTLLKTMENWGHPYITDPSNDNHQFDRVRWRQLLPSLAQLGITSKGLERTIMRLTQADQTLDEITTHELLQRVDISPLGYALINFQNWRHLPPEIHHRFLIRLLLCIGSSNYPPRFEAICRLNDLILSSNFSGYTLAGCRLLKHQQKILVVKEMRHKIPDVSFSSSTLWDNRFQIHLKSEKNLIIRAMGIKQAEELASSLMTHPAILASLPVLIEQEKIVFIPHFPDFLTDFCSVTVVFAPKQPLTRDFYRGRIFC